MEDNIPVYGIPLLRSSLLRLVAPNSAVGQFFQKHPNWDLVILNGMFHPSLPKVGSILRRMGIPYIVAPHSSYSNYEWRRNAVLKFLYWRLFERPLMNGAAGVQLLDDRFRKNLEQRGVRGPFLEVPNGSSLANTADLSTRRFNSDRIDLFFFGRVEPFHKGLDLLIEAIYQVRDEIPIYCTIQGPSSKDALRLEKQVDKWKLDEIISFLQPDYCQAPTEIMRGYDVFCMPSRWEGFGLSALEAMAAGIPVMVSERSGIAPHVICAECGITVEPTVEGIAAGLRNLWENRQEWPLLGKKGAEYANSALSWGAVGASAAQQYSKLLARNGNS